jgi:hypothetical protein
MQTLKIELTREHSLKALQELERQSLIRILNEPDPIYIALPGNPISTEDFRKLIEQSENSPSVNLTEAKRQWAEHKKNLKNLIR